MKLRITFRSEVYVEGKTMRDCIKQWAEMPLYHPDNKCSLVELSSIEDADTYEDKMNEWDENY